MLQRLWKDWFKLPQRPRRTGLQLNELEGREVPAVTLRDVPDQLISSTRPTYLPITITNVPGVNGLPAFSAQGGPGLKAEVLTNIGRSVRFDILGKDTGGVEFSGTITIQLFENIAPQASQRIVELIEGGYYTGKTFHRVSAGFTTINDFIIQGGSPFGDGIGGSGLPQIVDEYDSDYTFASTGVVAMANAGDDGNDAQFFITQPDVPFQNRPQFLNFNHTIVGLMTAGFATYDKSLTTVKTGSTTPEFPLTITGATVFQDKFNAVVKLTPSAAFTSPVNVILSATDGDGTATDSVLVTPALEANNPVSSNRNSRAFLGPVTDVTMFAGSSISIPFTARDIDGDPLTFELRDGSNFNNPAQNLTYTVNNNTGVIAITPNPGFTGNITLKVGVRDQFNRSQFGLDGADNFDTAKFTLKVAPPPAITLAASASAVLTNAPLTFTASLTSNVVSNISGTVEFVSGSNVLGTAAVVNGAASLTTSFPTAGIQNVFTRFIPTSQNGSVANSNTQTITITAPSSPPVTPPVTPPPVTPSPVSPPLTPPSVSPPFSPSTFTVIGSDPGSEPLITVFNADGSTRFTIQPFESTFRGGVIVAQGDVTGDGVNDIIAVPGFGGGPIVRVYDSNTAAELTFLEVFESTFRGGLNLAVSNANNVNNANTASYSQIIVGAGLTGGPRVRILDLVQGTTVADFFAHDPNSRGGVSFALTDLVKDKSPKLVTSGFAPGRVAETAIFNPTTGQPLGTAARGPAIPEPVLPTSPISRRSFLGSFVPPAQTVLPQGIRVVPGSPGDNGVRPLFLSTFDALSSGNTLQIDPISFVNLNELS